MANPIEPNIRIETKRLKRHLRVTAVGRPALKYFRELKLTYPQWEALKEPTSCESVSDWDLGGYHQDIPGPSRGANWYDDAVDAHTGHLVLQKLRLGGTMWMSRDVRKLVWRGEWENGKYKYYLSPLGERVVPQLPDCPDRSEWAPPTEAMKKREQNKGEFAKVEPFEQKFLEEWQGGIPSALPLGGTDFEEDEWMRVGSNARMLRTLFLKGLCEPGVAFLEKNYNGRLVPLQRGSTPTIVYRRTPRALLGYG